MHRRASLPAALLIVCSLVVCSLVGAASAYAQGIQPDTAAAPATPAPATPAPAPDLEAPLPLDSLVRTGELENGLRYYIRPNDEPQNRAELRLIINAGSLQEDEDQLGLAHFVEHMLFNGTRRYEKQELVSFLERLGMKFGPDVNASTSFDRTLYRLTVPTDSAGVVEESFNVLQEWAAHATLSDEEVEKERGIIIEEWRARLQSAQGRMQKEILPALVGEDSRYARRLPIGDTTIIKNAPPERLHNYYESWYRPNLMGVVAVGDFEPDSIEALIRDRFAGLENPPDAPERVAYDLPDRAETTYEVASDPEFPVSVASVNFRRDAEPTETVGDFRENIVRSLFYGMLNRRLSEKAQEGDVPFLRAGGFESGLVRPATLYGVQAQVPDDSILAGMEATLTEAARIRQHGFTATELERQKQEVLRQYKRAYDERENLNSSGLAGELASVFLTGEAAPGVTYEYNLAQALVPGITLEDVNEVAGDLFADDNRIVLVQKPEKQGVPEISTDELAAVLDRVANTPVEPYEDAAADVPLMSDIPEPAEVTERSEQPELGVTRLTLANGVEVILKPTDFKDDEVRFTASSPGGLSQLSDSAYATAQYAASVVRQSGVGPFTETQLGKFLAGKTVNVRPYIGETEEGLRGAASPENLETLFQLIYQYVTAPRLDSSALASFQRQQRAYLQNRSVQPQAVFQDSLRAALYGDHPRAQPPSVTTVDALSRDTLLSVYRDRFADVSDFTFTFVGTFEPDSLAPLVQTYLGTLPAQGRTEEKLDKAPDIPEEPITTVVEAGQGERSEVLLLYHGPINYNRPNRYRLNVLEGVLGIELREELREERSGVYGVSVNASASGAPDPGYTFSVSFTTDPDRVAELIGAATAVIDSVKAGKVSTETVQKVKEQQVRSRETALESNSFWVSTLDFYYTTPNENPVDILNYEQLVTAATPAYVAETARLYLDPSRLVRGVLYPEGYEGEKVQATSQP